MAGAGRPVVVLPAAPPPAFVAWPRPPPPHRYYAAPDPIAIWDHGPRPYVPEAPDSRDYNSSSSCFTSWKPSDDRIPDPVRICPTCYEERGDRPPSPDPPSRPPVHRDEPAPWPSGRSRPSPTPRAPSRYESPARRYPRARPETHDLWLEQSQSSFIPHPPALWPSAATPTSPYRWRSSSHEAGPRSDGYSTPRILVRPDQWVDDASDYGRRSSAGSARGGGSCASSRSRYSGDSPRGSLWGSSRAGPLPYVPDRLPSVAGHDTLGRRLSGIRTRSLSTGSLRQPAGEVIGVSFYPVGMGIHSNGADRREGYLTPTSRQRLELLYDTELKYLIQGVDAGFPIYSDFTRFERPTLKQGKTGNWGPGPPRPILKRQSSSSSTLSSSSSSSSGGIGQEDPTDAVDAVETRSQSVASSNRSAASMGFRRGRGYASGYYHAPKDASSARHHVPTLRA